MKRNALTLIAVLLASSTALAEITLHPLISDHAVLQRDRAVPVWGKADAGEKVTVTLSDHSADTTAGPDGTWRAELPAMKAGGPFEMIVNGSNEVRVQDVYVGEVWLASGQSNMEFTVSKTVKRWAGTINEEVEIAQADHPMIRMITVPLTLSETPLDTIDASWEVCSPETVPAFSAIGYFFAREIQKAQNVPVGIISSAFGASCAQAWISRDALEERFQPMLDTFQKSIDDFNSGAAQAKYDVALKEWEAAAEKAKADGKSAPRKPGAPRDPLKDQHEPTLCYNAMIAPLNPYAFRGALWYQGESNGWDNERYLPVMKTLIADWRSRWDNEFPFLFVQLASYKTPATQPVASSQIASVREAQRLTLDVPNTAMASTIDIGDAKDVHPHNKQEVGRRLALAARATVYGETIEYAGPLFESAKVGPDGIHIGFKHARGLTTRAAPDVKIDVPPGTVLGFSMLIDGDWIWADARIEGDKVVLSTPTGRTPTEVRYGWADHPICTLFNGEGLPASPFRAELKP